MKITRIHASAGRTFNHPTEQYANFRFDLHFEAEIEDGEDPLEASRQLAAHAEELQARITQLTSKPLALLGGKQIHAGHEEHPDTNPFGFRPDDDGDSH